VAQQVWQLQQAKSKFSAVVDQALKQGPQLITRHGVEAVVVLSYQDYRKMLLSRRKLSDFFHDSPLAGVALDLARDKRPWRGDLAL
jgi:prevent-host-death family protein